MINYFTFNDLIQIKFNLLKLSYKKKLKSGFNFIIINLVKFFSIVKVLLNNNYYYKSINYILLII